MAPTFLTPDLEPDLPLIRFLASAEADRATGLYPGYTWDEQFDRAYARYLDRAKGHRACELHRQEQAIEDARRVALSARERRILELRDAAHLAPMIDCTADAMRVRNAAERELAALMAEAV